MNWLTAWRDERSIEDAIRHHDNVELAKDLTVGLTFIVTALRSTKYGPLIASFADPNLLTGAGLCIAWAISRFGHWATAGALAAAAGQGQPGAVAAPAARTDAGAAPAGQVGSQPAERGAADAVQPGPDALTRQDDDAVHAGG